MNLLDAVDQLEATVGKRPPGWHLKSIAMVDDHCADFLARATFAVLGVLDADRHLQCVPLGGDPGVVRVIDSARVHLDVPAETVRAITGGQDEISAALFLLLPGYRETLRVNGRLRDRELTVEEAFLHCAKCVMRSRLWEGEHAPTTGAIVDSTADPSVDLHHRDVTAFLERSPFITLTTSDAHDEVDVSPKGDPAGFVRILGPTTLAIPDRPGNGRTDTFHNLVENPQVCLLALIPGDDRILRVWGGASMTNDPNLLAGSAIKGRQPAALLLIEVTDITIEVTPAMADARLWEAEPRDGAEGMPRSSRIWTDHVKLNEDPGTAAKVARLAMRESVLRAGLATDYKNNLY